MNRSASVNRISSRPLITLLAILATGLFVNASPAQAQRYEVWAADQNGNTIYVLDPQGNLLRSTNIATSAKANRPHVLTVSRDGKQILSANTASNSVSIHSLPGGEVVGFVENVGKSPHAVVMHPKDSNKAYVFNIGPKAVDAQGQVDTGETLTELLRKGSMWQVGRRLDLRGATALADNAKFPSRRPVLGAFSRNAKFLVVSLLTGGLAIVDVDQWTVTEGIGNDRVHQNVTLVVPSPDGRELYITAGNQQESWLHVMDVSGAPRLVASHDLSALGKDAHGAAIDPARRELWIAHRVSNNLTIHPLAGIRQSQAQAATLPLGSVAPDLIAISPDGRNAYVTLRGPTPAPTIPFALVGETPGVVVVDVPGRKVAKFVPLGDPKTGDFHAVTVVPVK